MSQIFELIMDQLGGNRVQDISRQIGADEAQTKSAMSAILPTLLGAITKNADNSAGQEALHGALQRDHDGSIFGRLDDFVQNPAQGNGAGILRHVLGDKRQTVERNIGGTAGLQPEATGRLMEMMAPMVMGALGKQQKDQGFNAGSLAGFLGKERQAVEPKTGGLIDKLLDADGDGDLDLKDLLSHGSKFMNPFKK